jgi:flagellar M-ring protein FliF
VEIVNLRFAELPQNLAATPKGWLDIGDFTKDDIMRGIEMLVMFLLGMVVLFFVIRPLVRRIITPDEPALALPEGSIVGLPGGIGPGGITTTGGPNVSIVGSDQNVAISNHTSSMIDIAKVQGQVHAESVKKVGELADRNPHETVAIIRQWLHEPA